MHVTLSILFPHLRSFTAVWQNTCGGSSQPLTPMSSGNRIMMSNLIREQARQPRTFNAYAGEIVVAFLIVMWRRQSLCSSADFLKVAELFSAKSSLLKKAYWRGSPRKQDSMGLLATPFLCSPAPALVEEPDSEDVSACKTRAGLWQMLQWKMSIPARQLSSTSSMSSMLLQGCRPRAVARGSSLWQVSTKAGSSVKVSAAKAGAPLPQFEESLP